MMLRLRRGVLRLGSSKGKPPNTMTYRMTPIAHTSASQAVGLAVSAALWCLLCRGQTSC